MAELESSAVSAYKHTIGSGWFLHYYSCVIETINTVLSVLQLLEYIRHRLSISSVKHVSKNWLQSLAQTHN